MVTSHLLNNDKHNHFKHMMHASHHFTKCFTHQVNECLLFIFRRKNLHFPKQATLCTYYIQDVLVVCIRTKSNIVCKLIFDTFSGKEVSFVRWESKCQLINEGDLKIHLFGEQTPNDVNGQHLVVLRKKGHGKCIKVPHTEI